LVLRRLSARADRLHLLLREHRLDRLRRVEAAAANSSTWIAKRKGLTGTTHQALSF